MTRVDRAFSPTLTRGGDDIHATLLCNRAYRLAGTNERKHADLLLYSVLKPVLESEPFGYTVKRADQDADPGMIGDRIISDILNAELVIADLTDLNPNVFYELGIRHLAAKPAIHIGRAGTVLPFDTISHRTIFVDLMDWHSQEAARKSLEAAVKTVQQPGYVVSNPVTQANASFKLRQSSDPNEVLIAELRERVDQLEAHTKPVSRPDTGLPDTMFDEAGLRALTDALLKSDVRKATNAMGILFPAAPLAAATAFVDAILGRRLGEAHALLVHSLKVPQREASYLIGRLSPLIGLA